MAAVHAKRFSLKPVPVRIGSGSHRFTPETSSGSYRFFGNSQKQNGIIAGILGSVLNDLFQIVRECFSGGLHVRDASHALKYLEPPTWLPRLKLAKERISLTAIDVLKCFIFLDCF